MIRKALNITTVKHDLLRLVAGGGEEIVITKAGVPVATLTPGAAPEKSKLPVLIMLGAKPCAAELRGQTLELCRLISSRFSLIVWVYSAATAGYLEEITDFDVLAVETTKTEQPIITSIKAGLSCVSESARWFMYLFLNRPVPAVTINFLLDRLPAARTAGKGIIVPRREKQPAHPLLFSSVYKDRIMRTRKELGMPHIIRRHRHDVMFCDL
ncbi:MAG TPA: hypothetical protein ENN66_09025 [Proteobacteria bacterium]|nr:hypothetical protein [Pseudomonadota bacterium]